MAARGFGCMARGKLLRSAYRRRSPPGWTRMGGAPSARRRAFRRPVCQTSLAMKITVSDNLVLQAVGAGTALHA